jgi:hypothetical protein
MLVGGGVCFDFFWGVEYEIILFMRLLFCIIFLGSDLYSFFFVLDLLLFLFLFLWVRGTRNIPGTHSC